MSSAPVPDVHRHREAEPSPRDSAFIRGFLASFLSLAFLCSTLVWLTDPFAVFGTGLIPPVVSADRDYKVSLYRKLANKPEVIILGSSRVKTLDPACIQRVTGRSAFNFGVNAGGADDYLAIYRFLRADPQPPVRQIILGADPEALQEDEGENRALAQSRALGLLAPDGVSRSRAATLSADLLSQESVGAALRSLRHRLLEPRGLPQEALRDDGLQSYPVWDDEIRRGVFPEEERVLGSVPGVLGRYTSFPRLSLRKVGYLQTLVKEAHADGVEVIAFIPPVHPALERAAEGSTVLQQRSAEAARLLRRLESEGMLRYLETRSLENFGGDSTLYYDAIHLMPTNADRLLATLLGHPSGCALQ